MKRYVNEGKTYIVPNLDMERDASKKAQRRLDKLDGQRREVFLRIWDGIRLSIDWDRFSGYVETSLKSVVPNKRPLNIYDLGRRLNRLIAKVDNWVRRNSVFSNEKVLEFALQVLKIGRSICRRLDPNATCWKNNSKEIVEDHVRKI